MGLAIVRDTIHVWIAINITRLVGIEPNSLFGDKSWLFKKHPGIWYIKLDNICVDVCPLLWLISGSNGKLHNRCPPTPSVVV